MRRRPRRRPELGLLLAALLAGCATTEQPSVKVDVLKPEEAERRSVAVLADIYMQDFELADHLRESLRQECLREGFDVKSTENDADLVLVPSMTVSSSGPEAAPPRTVLRPPRLFDTSLGSLSGRGLSRLEASPPDLSPRLVLTVSAYRRQDWLDPQFIDGPIPKAWRIVVADPRREGQEMPQIAGMMTACGKALRQLAAPASRHNLAE